MNYSSADAAREICDIFDTLLVVAKHDRAPMRAVSLLEEARSELQDYLDRADQDDGAASSSLG